MCYSKKNSESYSNTRLNKNKPLSRKISQRVNFLARLRATNKLKKLEVL